eukprot:Polyplicarium_translucidae@DN3279_c1_g2_i1.p1
MRSASRFRWYIPTTACRMRTNLATVTMRPAFFDRAFFVKSSKTIIEIPHRHTSLPNCSRFGTKVFRLLNDSNTRRGKQQQSDPTRLLEDAMECLRITAAPTQLVCRESERAKVLSLLSNAVTCGSAGAALYISGMPGTGKSATIHAVLKEMKELSEDGELPSFEAITINAMSLSAPDSIYTEIYRGIFKTRKVISRHAACRALDSHFRSGSSRAEKKRPVCVLVIDEVDSLVTAKQRVLYTLFDWPTCPNSRLVVVTIANTMDLPERMIPRCASRLGFGRMNFFPYSKEQIGEIVEKRLEQCGGLFSRDAVTMCARKVASVSGDIRKALHVCRRALETAGGQPVQIAHVVAAERELHESPFSSAIQLLPFLQQMLLLAFALEIRANVERLSVPIRNLKERMETLMTLSGRYSRVIRLSLDQIWSAIQSLAESNFISICESIPFEAIVKKKAVKPSPKKKTKPEPSRLTEQTDLPSGKVLASAVDEPLGHLGIEPSCEVGLALGHGDPPGIGTSGPAGIGASPLGLPLQLEDVEAGLSKCSTFARERLNTGP